MIDSTNELPKNTVCPRYEQRVFRICILSGMIDAHDAIGACILTSLDGIQMAADRRGPRIEIRIYCLSSSIDDPRLHRLADWRNILADEFYVTADLIIHHFGIFSEIHNALGFARRSTHLVVVYHGVTPPQYLAPSAQDVMQKSFRQLGLINQADEIIVTSQTVRQQLQHCGINRPVRQIELFGPNAVPNEMQSGRSRNRSGEFKIVYCGRFVGSKGVLELVHALTSLEAGTPKICLTLVGIKRLSDENYIGSISDAVSRLPANIRVIFQFDQTQDELSSLIFGSDLLALPSLHEGFGIPIIEALMCGTPIVCSDAGALPEVAGGLAKTFQTGNWAALTQAIAECLNACKLGMVATDAGCVPLETWRQATRDITHRFSPAAYQGRWAAFIRERLDAPRDHSDTLVASLDAYKTIGFTPDNSSLNVLDNCVLNVVQTKMGNSPTNNDLARQCVADRHAVQRCILSIEHDEVFIRTAYHDIVGRQAENPIIESWLQDFRSGAPRQELLDTLFTSNAYIANFADREVQEILIFQNLRSLMNEVCSDSDFVRRAFRIALQRPIDDQALKAFYRALSRGRFDRTRLISSILLSEEYANRASATLGLALANQFKVEFKRNKFLALLKRLRRVWNHSKNVSQKYI